MCTPFCTSQLTFARYPFCPLLSRFEYIDWPLFTLKLALSRVGIWTPSNARFLRPTESTPQGHYDWVSSFCRGHSHDRSTDWPIDRTRYSVCSNRPQLAGAAMRRYNNKVRILHIAQYIKSSDALVVTLTHMLCKTSMLKRFCSICWQIM